MILGIILCLSGCGGTGDGEYDGFVSLSGGSGRAYIMEPCKVTISSGNVTAHIIWSSPNYDYMIIDGAKYYPVNKEGNSEFVIPVRLDEDIPVQADTTAMSTPHLIDYTLRISLSDKGEKEPAPKENTKVTAPDPPVLSGTQYLSTDENDFAECFAIHRYRDGSVIISVDDGRDYLLMPREGEIDYDLPEDVTVIPSPPHNIYLAASGVMCQLDAIGAVDNVLFSGLKRDAWYIPSARAAMDSGRLLYGGRYSAPDYEKMVSLDVELAIENTMILHTPKVLDKLGQLGIPVIIDRSSYEEHPLGRCEWVKVYGVICDREKEACKAFDSQKALVDSIGTDDDSDRTVAVFSINSNHQIITRRRDDYLAKMITMAGGRYLYPESDSSSRSQITISMEAFYDYAKEADILIYNASIEDAPRSLEELLEQNIILSDFKAAADDNIWYTDKSLYQLADRTGTVIDNLHEVISEGRDETEFLHRLQQR